MLTYTIRRLSLAIPTLLFISFVIFLLLELAPGDPMAQVPLTVPPEVKEQMRQALGLGEPALVQYWKWLVQFFWIEPQCIWSTDLVRHHLCQKGELRVISWQTRSPGDGHRAQRMPQTLWVVGHVLRRRRPDRLADRHLLGLQAVFGLRSGGHLRHDDRLLGPALLHRAAADRDLLGAARLVPVDLRHHATSSTTGTASDVQLQPDDHAGDGAGACRPPRSSAATCAPRCSTTSTRIMCAPPAPRACRRAVVVMVHVLRNSMIPVVTVIALGVPGDLRRRHHHRERLQGERHRPASDHRALCQRPADGDDADLHLRRR